MFSNDYVVEFIGVLLGHVKIIWRNYLLNSSFYEVIQYYVKKEGEVYNKYNN